MEPGAGRYAPSPSGPLHLGNLRTALLAWLAARTRAAPFVLRIDDLDKSRCRPEHEAAQLADLAALGITFDGQPLRQSVRGDQYAAALNELETQGAVYPCWCTRAELREAASAPHGSSASHVPGDCIPADRPPAIRANARATVVTVTDRYRGSHAAVVDDVVLRRADGTHAYHLATVVDDAEQGVSEVVRGEDLLGATGAQMWLIERLGLPQPTYAHVPLVLNDAGHRLAKRDGAVTLPDRLARGESAEQVLGRLATSVGLAAPGEAVNAAALLDRYDPDHFTPPPSGPLPS